MEKIKKHKPLLIFVASLLITFIVMGVYVLDSNLVKKKKVSDFVMSDQGFNYCVTDVQKGNTFSHIKAYCYPTDEYWEYYNYGFNSYGEGLYLNLGIGLWRDDVVYVLPTVQNLEDELFDSDERVQNTHSYNFYRGVSSKFFTRFIPKGGYKICLIYTYPDGTSYLLTQGGSIEI